LLSRNIGHDRPLLFITHSLGGLVVKQKVRHGKTSEVPRYTDFARRIRAIVFLSTPHRGSDYAVFGTHLSKVIEGKIGLNIPSELIDQLRKNDPYLRELSTWYNNTQPASIETLAMFEKYDTPILGGAGVRVVDESSGDPQIPKIRTIPMDADHISICKPT